MNTKGTILVVDDAAETLDLLAHILTTDGYEVLPAGSGELALSAVAARLPDLILLDVRLPGLDGFEVCRRLKVEPLSRDVPIMFISAFSESAERVEGFELGAVDFISMPIRPEELRARVRTHIELHRGRIELKASEARFHRAVLGSPFPILLHAEDGEIILASDSWCETAGYTREELRTIGDWTERAYGERKLLVQADIDRLFGLTQPVPEGDYEIRTKNGATRVWDFSSGPLGRLPDGRRLVISMAMDVTERRRAEEMLRRTDRALRMVSECNRSLVRATDEEGLLEAICRIVVDHGGYRMAWVGFAEQDEAKSVRPAAESGLDAGFIEAMGITWADTERGRGPTGTAIRTGQPVIARDIPADPAYGPWRAAAIERGYASAAALPLISGESAFGALMVYAAEPDAFNDEEVALLGELAGDLAYGITALRASNERIQAVAALQASERDLRNSQHIAHVGSWRLDVATGQVTWTEELYRMYGADPALPPPPYTEHEKLFTPASWERLSAALAHTRETGIPYELELETVRKDGSNGWMWVRGEVVKGVDGNTTALWGAAQDITGRKQMEEALRQKAEALRASNVEMEQFNRAMVGRELRMIELKQEINELCRRLGEPPRHVMDPLPSEGSA